MTQTDAEGGEVQVGDAMMPEDASDHWPTAKTHVHSFIVALDCPEDCHITKEEIKGALEMAGERPLAVKEVGQATIDAPQRPEA